MPNADELCEVRTQGGVFRDWTGVSVVWTYETMYARQFQLQLAEPSGGNRVSGGVLKLKPGDKVDIDLAGRSVIKEGYIANRQAAYDALRHGVQISGLSKGGKIISTSVDQPKGEFKGYSFSAIANRVLKPYGIRFSLKSAPQGADEPFKVIRIFPGETTWELIERLARSRGIWLSAEANGDLVGGYGGEQSGGSATLEEGVNVLSARCFMEDPAAEQVVMRSQMPGDDETNGKDAAQIGAKAKVPGGTSGLKVIGLAEEPLSQKELQQRAEQEVRKMMADNLQVVVSHRGWFKPGTNEFYNLGDDVTLKSPMVIPVGDGTVTLVVWGVTWSQDDKTGTTTTLDLRNPAAIGRRYQTYDDPSFSQEQPKAQPEEKT